MTDKKRTITIQEKRGTKYSIPELRFGGVWLGILGFRPGQKVEITPDGNQLIIKPLPQSDGNQ